MFQLEIAKIPYRDPWANSLRNRISGIGNKSTNIAYLYESPDSSTFRYRVYNMIQVIDSYGDDIGATYFSYDEFEVLGQLLDKFDAIVICRCRYSHKLNQLVTAAKAKSIDVIYDVDDMVFNPDFAHLIVDTLDQSTDHPGVWDHWFAYTARMGAALKLCDRAITTNKFLADQIQQVVDIPVSLIPNFMNHEQIDVSNRIFEQKLNNNFARNDEFHIGYFSGTPSHNKDYRIIENSLVELMTRHPDIHILIVGFLNSGSGLNEFPDRVAKLPLQDFVNLQGIIGAVEVNLVPLQVNRFTNCKSNLKYFEAGIAGTLTIASPICSYEEAIKNGENGYLSTSSQWTDMIEKVKSLGEHYPKMAKQCREDILDVYTPVRQSGTVLKVLTENRT